MAHDAIRPTSGNAVGPYQCRRCGAMLAAADLSGPCQGGNAAELGGFEHLKERK